MRKCQEIDRNGRSENANVAIIMQKKEKEIAKSSENRKEMYLHHTHTSLF